MKRNIKSALLLILLVLYVFVASCNSSGKSGTETTVAPQTDSTSSSLGSSTLTEETGTINTQPGITENESTQTLSLPESTESAFASGTDHGQTTGSESTAARTSDSGGAASATREATVTYPLPQKTTATTVKTETTVPQESSETTQTESTASESENTTQATASVTETTKPPVIDPVKSTSKLSFDNITNISKSKNVFVFIIDRFDRVFAETAFMREPSVFSSLEGFTYFEDNVSLYGHTYPSIAYLVTGNKLNGENRKDYLGKAYAEASTLEELKNNGYQVNVFTDSYYGYNTDYYVSKYVSNAVDNKSDKAKYSTKLDVLEEYYNDAEFKSVDGKVFSFIHLAGCHDCYFGGGTAPEALKDAQAEKALTSLKRNFAIINRYIEKMKEYGVYDNATIIITGDHGAAISDKKPLDGIRTTALFVKPSGSGKGSIVRSSAQSCHDDIWATIFKSEGIKTKKSFGVSVFDLDKNTQRERTYLWHALVKNEEDKSVYIEYKYVITGSALEFDNWELVETTDHGKSLYT